MWPYRLYQGLIPNNCAPVRKNRGVFLSSFQERERKIADVMPSNETSVTEKTNTVNFKEANEKIAEGITEGYEKIGEGIVTGYKQIESGAVGSLLSVLGMCMILTWNLMLPQNRQQIF